MRNIATNTRWHDGKLGKNSRQQSMIQTPNLADVITGFPYRLALAGGWIDQPFVSRYDPDPPGSMVVVSVEPVNHYMERSGIATSTRKVAIQRWGGILPNRDPAALVRELYYAENEGKDEPSGSQDMIGLIYPGISRLDYDIKVEGGYFPAYIENNTDPEIAAWVERVINILPLCPRPAGYNPIDIKNLRPDWVRRLGQSGRDCYNAILSKDARAFGESINKSMHCWEALMPHNLVHPTLTVNIKAFMDYYGKKYCGVMPSGPGGGYLYVISEEPVPGAFHAKVRLK
jgi:hypothetical protein